MSKTAKTTELNIEERFWAKVNKSEGCWVWSGYIAPNGYGLFTTTNGKMGAHRFAYELVNGEIPKGLCIDHLCRNTVCVNPDHLEAVTQRENLLRGKTVVAKNTTKTHCIRGHEFTSENTYTRTRTIGGRECRQCRIDKRFKIGG